MSLLAARYAESLLSLAIEKDKVELYRDQIELIADSFDMADVKAFFASSKVSKDEKKELCRNIFADSVDKYVLNFLFVLIDRNRMVNYREIFAEFRHQCNRQLDIDEGIIETARPLKEELIKELEDSLSRNGKRVELREKINRSLISGFKISFADRIIDNSMKNKIRNLEDNLLRKDGSLWN